MAFAADFEIAEIPDQPIVARQSARLGLQCASAGGQRLLDMQLGDRPASGVADHDFMDKRLAQQQLIRPDHLNRHA